MANLAYDSNKEDTETSTSNILAPSAAPKQEGNEAASNDSYVSDGNPYGGYATNTSQQTPPPQPQAAAAPTSTQAQMRKSQTGPSSGNHTNVQTYVNKNQQSSQQLGGAVEGKLQNTADLVRQNTANVNKQFNQGVEGGSLENWQTAKDRAGQAFNEAAQVTAPTKNYVENTASMYTPTALDQTNKVGSNDPLIKNTPQYSTEDQALIDSNKARVIYGDNTSKEFGTQLEAQNSIDDWNRLNPGYNQYGDQQQLSMSDKELSDILNAKYTGPTDLYQTSGYNDLVNEFGNASTLQKQALDSGYKGELLKQTFSNPNTDYTLGQSLLDDLLLGQGDVGKNLKQTAKGLGNSATGLLSDEFENTKQSARDIANQRDADINNVRKDSRSLLNETALNREKEVNDRLSGVLKDWDKYPQYFRDQLTAEMTKHEEKIGKKDIYDKEKIAYDKLTNQYNTLQKEVTNTKPSNLVEQFKNAQNIANDPNSTYQQQADAQSRLNELTNLAPGGNTGYGAAYNLAYLDKDNNNALTAKQKQLQDLTSQYNLATENMKQFSGLENFDKNNMNLGLSQLEAEMLGIKGGEGLYNVLKNQGVEGLIKTAQADKNQLVSRDEQNQLSRLQGIAELANDYGSVDSGIDYLNKFTNRDAAGEQNALSALDMQNFTNLLQGGEKQFQDYAKGANITGVGSGKATSGGAFGTKKKTSTKYLTENLGNLIEKSGGYRNMYSDEGINQDNVNQILGLSKGINDGTYQSNTPNLTPDEWGDVLGVNGTVAGDLLNTGTWALNPGGVMQSVGNAGTSISSGASDAIKGGATNILGNNLVGDTVGQYFAAPTDIVAELGRGLSNLGGSVSGALFGSNKGLQAKADATAQAAAQADLKKKVNQSIIDQGYGNQFSVKQDQQRDLELLKLLGLLDTTNR